MKRSIFFVFLTLFAGLYAKAQQTAYTTNNEAAIKSYALANVDIDGHSYDEAIGKLQRAVHIDDQFIEAYIVLADLYRLRHDNNNAIENYKKAIAVNPEYNKGIYIKLGECEVNAAKYADAQRHLEKYLCYPNISGQNTFIAQKLLNDCAFSLNALQHPVDYKPVNLGPEINTADDEYSPVATADDKTLIFTRKINANEDFYQSVRKDDKWQTATYLSNRINTPMFNEGSESISQDGKFLFFTGCNRPDGQGRCDIYFSQKKGNEWGKPFDLSSPVNTPGWESQPSLSADGRTLYFVSNRKGGYGGYDIWKSKLTPKGWGEPENLGPNINTSLNEQSPFIHADDSTLYFCSNGWPGMGGQDLFMSKLGKDGKWQKAVNLGYPINTNGDESGLTLTADGSKAYFASNNLNGYGGFDIYTFELPENFKPHLVTYVKGIVGDAKTARPLEAAVQIIDLQNNQPVYQDYSSPDEGDFLATLTAGKNYGLNISKDGYLFYSENFSLVGHGTKNPFDITVLLQPIEIGNKVILKNIFFDTNKFNIKPESATELAQLVQFLTLNPTLRIEISGYTDDVGNDQVNQTLSENRAKAVYNYLISAKIDPYRLVYKGYGKTQPVAPNTTEEDRAQNRRTEFKIIAK